MARPREQFHHALGQKAFEPDDGVTQILGPKRGVWREDALCRQVDPELWFPDKGGVAESAKRICHECPVKSECLTQALAMDERIGVWGGLSGKNRRPYHQAVNAGADPEDVALAALYGQEALRRWSA